MTLMDALRDRETGLFLLSKGRLQGKKRRFYERQVKRAEREIERIKKKEGEG